VQVEAPETTKQFDGRAMHAPETKVPDVHDVQYDDEPVANVLEYADCKLVAKTYEL